MADSGQPLGSFSVASGGPAPPAASDARLWLPADAMYSLRLEAGTRALVGLAGGNNKPRPLAAVFLETLVGSRQSDAPLPETACEVNSTDAQQAQHQPPTPHPGGCLVAAELWPMQGLSKGSAALSSVLRDALARPPAGTQLLVYSADSWRTDGSGSSTDGPPNAVFLRMWQQPSRDGSGPRTLLLPDEEPADSASALEQGVGHPGVGGTPPSPATTRDAGAPAAGLSPAMRGSGAAPAALSPAMRASSSGRTSGGASPLLNIRGRSAGASAATPKASGASTASVASAHSSAGSGAGRTTSKQAASSGSERDTAKVEALLDALSLDPEHSARPRQMLEALLLRQLAGRRLLAGNIVELPLFGQLALFVVECVLPAGPAACQPVTQTSDTPAAGACWPAAVAATSRVSLLLGRDSPPSELQEGREQEDVAAKAAALAAEALGCTLDDAGALAARHAAAAGMASRRIEFEELGGVARHVEALKQLVVLPLRSAEVFSTYNITPPRGVLLYGPPGTGKTVLACAAATAAGAHLLVLNGPDIVSEHSGESEAGLRGVFAAAAGLAPALIFIDELDALAPARSGPGGRPSAISSTSARMVATLATEMDMLKGAPVVVLAATNRPDALDDGLRRPGRFDREVEVGAPTPAERRDMLEKLLQHMSHDLTPRQVVELADVAHGFVAADMAGLCNEAAMTALRRIVRGQCDGDSDPCVTFADFTSARALIRPSAMRELVIEVPKVTWDDIGGLEDVKQQLKEAVELPFKNPEALKRLGVVPPRGVLLYGPPGCSKTLLARAVASESKLNFISVKGPELFNKYVGESEKALAALFSKARQSSPAVIFFDELDGMVMSRDDGSDGGVSVGDRMLSTLLQEMDGLQLRSEVIVIAATNRKDFLDPALLRPGRFDRLVHVPPPDAAARAAIFAIQTRRMPLGADVAFDDLAQQTDSFTGAMIATCCKDAALAALEEDMDIACVSRRHFEMAIASRNSQNKAITM